MKEKWKNRKKLTLLQRRSLTGYLFILPWLIGFLYFYVRSIILTVQFSFSDLTMNAAAGGYELENVGFYNYIYAFRVHGWFKQILTSSIINTVVDVPLIIFFSLFVAMLLNKKFPGRAVIRVIFFLPIIMAAEAVTDALNLSMAMMNGGTSAMSAELVESAAESGGVNIEYVMEIFIDMGIPLRLMEYVIAAVARINSIIAASGVQIIIFLAALQSIPGSLYEVADIEGATGYETFWKITFPMVTPHIITNIVYTVVDGFVKSEVVTLAYDAAFSDFQYGLSAVFSIVSTMITLAILFLVVYLIQKRTFYYN
jgi:ABC-type sugar transport system permease subunit